MAREKSSQRKRIHSASLRDEKNRRFVSSDEVAVKASAKGVRMSPRKVSVVAALVRDRSVADALIILEHTPRRAQIPVKKVLLSVRANAENNHGLKASTLKISHISVTSGPRLKRYRPAAHGRALPFQRKSSHIFVEVVGSKPEPKKPTTNVVSKKAGAK